MDHIPEVARTSAAGVIDVDDYSPKGAAMLKEITKIVKSVLAELNSATNSALSKEIKVLNKF